MSPDPFVWARFLVVLGLVLAAMTISVYLVDGWWKRR